MFTISLVLGVGLFVGWWFRELPDALVYISAIPVFLMAFSSTQRKFMFWRSGAQCEYNSCTKSWEAGYMLEAHHKVPLHNGGCDDVNNGEMLCIPHHAQRHEQLARNEREDGNYGAANADAYSARKIKQRSIWRNGHGN